MEFLEFKSVDDLIENCSTYISDPVDKSTHNICKHVAHNCSITLLRTLESKRNEPSVYDLTIIKILSELKGLNMYQKRIIDIYNSRK